MEKIVARHRELQILKRLYSSDEAELFVKIPLLGN